MCLVVETQMACGHSENLPITCEAAFNRARDADIVDVTTTRCQSPEIKFAWSLTCCEPCFQDFFNNLRDGACIMCRDWMDIRWQREIGRMFGRGLIRDIERFEQSQN